MNFSKTSLANEHSQLRAIGFTTNDLIQFTLNAVDAAFCDEAFKHELREKLAAEGFTFKKSIEKARISNFLAF